MRITAIAITVVEIPQTPVVAPYRSHLRSSSSTRSAIVRLDTDAGLVGWGEYNVNLLPGISANRMQADAAGWLLGRAALDVVDIHHQCPLEVRLKSGIEMAMWDLRGKAAGQSVAMLLGGILRPQVELAACMGIQSYERARELAVYYVDQGFSTLKTKAGADLEGDGTGIGD